MTDDRVDHWARLIGEIQDRLNRVTVENVRLRNRVRELETEKRDAIDRLNNVCRVA